PHGASLDASLRSSRLRGDLLEPHAEAQRTQRKERFNSDQPARFIPFWAPPSSHQCFFFFGGRSFSSSSFMDCKDSLSPPAFFRRRSRTNWTAKPSSVNAPHIELSSAVRCSV